MPFSIGVKKTPQFEEVTRQVITTTASGDMARKLDFAYVLVKMVPSDDCVLPGWTGFNTLLCQDDIPCVSRVGYLPVIDASPTEYSTINTILKRSQEIADLLLLRYATWSLTRQCMQKYNTSTIVLLCGLESSTPSCPFCLRSPRFLRMAD